MTRIMKFALGSSMFFCGILAASLSLTGCSESSSTNEAPKIDGMSAGDYRDKMEIEAQKGSMKRAKRASKAAR